MQSQDIDRQDIDYAIDTQRALIQLNQNGKI